MRVLQIVFSAIYSPSFYSSAPRASTGAAFGYFLLLIAFLTIVKMAVMVVPALTQLTPEIQQFVRGMGDSYPTDLAIHVQNGQVSTNAPEPYVIPLGQSAGSSDVAAQNLIVIDTTHPFSMAQFDRYQAIAWLTKDSVVVRGQSPAETRTYDLAQVGNLTIDKATVNGWIGVIYPFTGLVAPIVGIFALFGLYLAYLVRLAYLLVLALFILVVVRLLKVHLNYAESYKLGLYAMTTALIVELLLALLYPVLHYDGFLFMFGAITLAVVAVNILAGRAESAPGESSL